MNLGNMMQQAQQMKEKMAEMQAKVLQMDIPGESGGGMVQVVINGKTEVKSVKIDPSIVTPDDVEVLEDLVAAAINDARGKAERLVAEETQRIMEEMGLPSNMGDLPF